MSLLTTHWQDIVAPVWRTHWGEPLVVITRTDVQTITGVVSRTTGQQETEDGFVLVMHDVDILFVASDVTVCIDAGTRIEQTVADKIVTYEVLAEAGQPAWEYDDPQRIKIKVRAKRIGEGDAES